MKKTLAILLGVAAVAAAALAVYNYGKKKGMVGCMSNADCAAGSKCVAGMCVSQPCGGRCPKGTKCENEKCVMSGKCSTSEHCPEGMVCIGEKCVSPAVTDCKSNLDCSLGYGCTPDGVCVPPSSVPCSGVGANCPAGWQCLENKCAPKPSQMSGPSTFWDD